ncbi:hypothetical protein EYR40_004956 [Pleurotus pulmonarius]|nr:hypothetical protein EYR40_004956 [Pleurotus pulmonarius]
MPLPSRSPAATRIKRPLRYQGPLPAENPKIDVARTVDVAVPFLANFSNAVPLAIESPIATVCEPTPPERFIRKAVRFNYHCGRYIHAIGLKTLGYDRLPSDTHQRGTLWSLISTQHVAVVNIRRRQGTDHSNPFRDFEFMDSHKLSVELLDLIRPGCKARATALLALRPFEMSFVVCLVLYSAELEHLGAQCFLHKVPEFKVNEYPRVTIYNAPQMLNRLLTSKARTRT